MVKLNIIKREMETMVLELVVETEKGTKTKRIDLSGNSISPAYWGATEVVKALNEILE